MQLQTSRTSLSVTPSSSVPRELKLSPHGDDKRHQWLHDAQYGACETRNSGSDVDVDRT